jgi:hypothetical protein
MTTNQPPPATLQCGLNNQPNCYKESDTPHVERRTKQGKTRKAIMRCLMRYIAREIFNTLKPQLHLT